MSSESAGGPMLRIVGPREECERAIAVLRTGAALYVSPFYSSPGERRIVRVFVSIRAWKTEAGEGQ